MKPILIGIAGPSCSGKTELARALAKWLPGGAPVVTLDSYYHALDHLSLAQRAETNFDHPDALDWNTIISDVRDLAVGRPINEPIYLFETHTRATESKPVQPGRFVITEGLFTLHSEAVRELLDARFFVSTPDAECYRRRLSRDIAERGRTESCIRTQYDSTVRPMAEAYVIPTKRFADLVVKGDQPMDHSIAMVKEYLSAYLRVAASA